MISENLKFSEWALISRVKTGEERVSENEDK